MTVAIGIEIEAGGRAVTGKNHASEPGAADANAGPSISDMESFRSRWQAMLNSTDTGPGSGPGSGPGTRLGTGIDAENTGEKADVRAEIATVAETKLPKGAMSSVAGALPNRADSDSRYSEITEQKSGQQAGTTTPAPSRSQSGISGWRASAASQVQSISAAQTSEASGDARADRFTRTGKRESVAQRTNTNPPATAENGPHAATIFDTTIPLTPNPAAAAQVMQAQVAPMSVLPAPQSNIENRVLSPNPERDSGPSVAEGPVSPVRSAAMTTTGTAARAGTGSQAASGSLAAATRSEAQDNETNGILAGTSDEARELSAPQPAALPRSMGRPAGEPQQAASMSQPHAENAGALAEAAKAPPASSVTQHEAISNSASNFQFPTAIADTDRPSMRGGQSMEEAMTRLAHRDSTGDPSQPGTQTVLVQPSSAGEDTAVLTRVSVGSEGTVSAMTDHAGVSAGAAPGTEARETFAGLDAGTGVGTPGWIHAGSQTAEAGFHDPELGWVGVRADLSGGSVHAALMPGSAEAAQALSVHLAGLNSYLAEQHTPVATLTMAAPGGSGIETGAGQGMQQGAGQNAGRSTSTEPQLSAQSGTAAIPAVTDPSAAAPSGGFDSIAHMGEMRGRHISVMA